MPAPIPREWNYFSNTGVGAQASIVVPAPLSGLSLQLTEVKYKLVLTAVGAGPAFEIVEVVDGNGPTTLVAWIVAVDLANIGEIGDTIPVSIPISPGSALTVRFASASGATYTESLAIRGYAA